MAIGMRGDTRSRIEASSQRWERLQNFPGLHDRDPTIARACTWLWSRLSRDPGGLPAEDVDSFLRQLTGRSGKMTRRRYDVAVAVFKSPQFMQHASQVALAAARDFQSTPRPAR